MLSCFAGVGVFDGAVKILDSGTSAAGVGGLVPGLLLFSVHQNAVATLVSFTVLVIN